MPIIQQIKVPLISVNDTSLTVVDILFKQAAIVQKGEIVLVLETSKTTYDLLAETDGFIGYTCDIECDYDVNDVIATIYRDVAEVPLVTIPVVRSAFAGEPANLSPMVVAMASVENIDSKQSFERPLYKPQKSNINFEGETIFSKASLALITLNNIDKSVFAGNDFISKADVEIYLRLLVSDVRANFKTPNLQPSPNVLIDHNKVIVQKLSSSKRKEIAYLSAVQSGGLTSTININIDTEGIFVHINQSMMYLKNSLLPVIIYESSRLLHKYRQLNAYFTGDAIALYNEVNIGFAIDLDKGLKVLKLPAAAEKGMNEIEKSILTLSNKYLDDTLHVDDLTDISFTITDLSAIDVSFFTPLVNNMNSAILGIAAIDERLQRCTLSCTFDHRVTDGKTVAQFLQDLKQRLASYQSKYHPIHNMEIQCFKCFKQLKDDISDTGFSRCVTPKGNEAFICQSCLKGF